MLGDSLLSAFLQPAQASELWGAILGTFDPTKRLIVAGDFNAFWGDHEIYLFTKATGLQSANVDGLPSYPSRAPRKELDFVLYGDGVRVTDFFIPQVSFSDHLPLVCDFEIDPTSRRAA